MGKKNDKKGHPSYLGLEDMNKLKIEVERRWLDKRSMTSTDIIIYVSLIIGFNIFLMNYRPRH